MLYERWCQISSQRSDDIALRDLATGRHWTFKSLRKAGESHTFEPLEFSFPQGQSPGFVLDVLSAWRAQRIVCPLESGQPRPQLSAPPKPCVHLKSTSATTSNAPRWVAFTAAQLCADADQIVATMGLRRDWPNLGLISMAHSYGFSNLILPLLLHGIPLLLGPSTLPEAVRRILETERALTLPAVPTLWRAWHDARVLTPTVRLAIAAGAPMPAALEQSIFRTAGIKVHNFYGSTECGGIAYDASDQPRTEDASVGAALRGVELSVNEDGCLTVRSQAAGETYWPEPSWELKPGEFHTSDVVELRDGIVHLRGRLSDLINVAGRKVSPASIEQALHQHPQVRRCLVFGVPEQAAARTEIVVACVAASRPMPAEELRKFLLDRLPAWQIPREWWFVDSLLENPRGKLSRSEWRRRYLEATARH